MRTMSAFLRGLGIHSALARPAFFLDQGKNALPRLLLVLLLCAGSAAAQETQQPDLNHLSLEDLMQVKVETVSGASKFIQRVADAPASVTIITGEQIQRYGYRTLADVLRSVRGFYVIYDRNYTYVGVRGFSRPGDYNARILFLLDGHRVNDNIYDGAYVGTEFPVDVDLIDRVEIIRGAGSTVYGTGAFIAVVNVVTKRGRDLDSVEFCSEGGSLNSYKGRVSYGDRFNNGLEMLLSGSVYDSQGHRRLFFPEFDSPATHNGVAVNADGDRSYNLFADFIYRDFNIHAVQASRTKLIPTASFGTVFNDPRTQTTDARSYIDGQYHHLFGEKWEVLGRASYDWYGYHGLYIYDYAGTGIPPFVENVDLANGAWSDFQFDASRTFLKRHRVTLGVEYRQDFAQNQSNYDRQPYFSYLDDHRRSRLWAYYLQEEFSIRRDLSFVAGLRNDWYSKFGNNLSPRLGLLYNPSRNASIKLMYSRAFRAPNSYESFYASNTSNSENPALHPERIRTIELAVAHQLGKPFRASVSGYLNRIDGLIARRPDPLTGQLVYTNSDILVSKGVEFELAARWPGGAQGLVSYSLQNSRNQRTGNVLNNSPNQLGKANLSLPLVQGKLFASFEGQYTSRRRSVSTTDLGGFFVVNANLFARKIKNNFDLSAGIYNLFDKRYADPASIDHQELSIPQDGRSFRIKLTYRLFSKSK